MTSRSLSVSVMGWMCACGLAALAAPASAQDCNTDADCNAGFVCMSYGTVDCGFACPEGEKCPDMPPDCAPMEIKGCSPAPCTADSECPDGMVCFSQTYTECSGGGAEGVPAEDPGAAGAGGAAGSGAEPPPPEPLPEDCKDVTQSMCAPKYVPPCKEAADCGAGFTCEEYESCGCSGSAGSAGGAAGEPAPPPEPTEPECTCEKTGEFYCKLVETTCATADECPDGFTCEANPNGVVCSTPAMMTDPAGTGGAAGGADGGAAGSGAGDTPTDSCGMTTEPEKVCLPPYWNTGFGGGGGRGVAQLGEAADGNAIATGSGAPEEPPTASGSNETAKSATGGDSGGFCSVAIVGNADSRNRVGLAALATAFALIALAVRRRRRVA